MKIIKENKENLPISFLTDFISKGWEEVGYLKADIEAIREIYKGTKNIEELIQNLIDAYLVCIGQLEAHISDKNYIEYPEESGLSGTKLEEDYILRVKETTKKHIEKGAWVLELDDGKGGTYWIEDDHWGREPETSDVDKAKQFRSEEDAKDYAYNASYDYIKRAWNGNWKEAGWDFDPEVDDDEDTPIIFSPTFVVVDTHEEEDVDEYELEEAVQPEETKEELKEVISEEVIEEKSKEIEEKTPIKDFEAFEYFVDFDDPDMSEPRLTDKDLYDED